MPDEALVFFFCSFDTGLCLCFSADNRQIDSSTAGWDDDCAARTGGQLGVERNFKPIII